MTQDDRNPSLTNPNRREPAGSSPPEGDVNTSVHVTSGSGPADLGNVVPNLNEKARSENENDPNDDVVEVEIPRYDSLKINQGFHWPVESFSMQDYEEHRVLIDISDVIDGTHYPREIDEPSKVELKKLLLSHGYRKVAGSIIVTWAETKDVRRPMAGEKIAGSKLVVVDGRHRLECLRELAHSTAVESQDQERWKLLMSNLEAHVLMRPDMQAMECDEIMVYGKQINDATGQGRKMSFYDNAYNAVHWFNAICTRLRIDKVTVPAGNLACALHKTALGHGYTRRHVARYALLVKRLAGTSSDKLMKDFSECCQDAPKLGITHFDHGYFVTQAREEHFLLILRALTHRLKAKMLTGRWDAYKNVFFEMAKKMIAVTERVASHLDKMLDDFLNEPMRTGRDGEQLENNVEMIFISTLATLDGRNPEKSAQARITSYKRQLYRSFGEPSVEGNAHQVGEQEKPADVSNESDDSQVDGVTGKPSESEGEVRLSKRKRKQTSLLQDDIASTRTSSKRRKGQLSSRRNRLVKKPADASARRTRASPTVRSSRRMKLVRDLSRMSDIQLRSLLREAKKNVFVLRRVGREEDGDGDEELIEKRHTDFDDVSGRKFDDSIPEQLPHGVDIGSSPQRNFSQPNWVMFAQLAPGMWPQSTNPIQDTSAWLKAIHMGDDHRSHVMLRDPQLLRACHHVTALWAAYNHYDEHRDEMNRFPLASFGISAEALTQKERLWALAKSNDTAGMVYFGQKSEELFQQGFCILRNFVADHEIPDTICGAVFQKGPMQGRFFVELMKHMNSTFPDYADLHSADDIWDVIVNAGAEADAQEKTLGQGRCTTKNYGVMGALEKRDTVWACTARAYLDARIGQTMSLLRLGLSSDGMTAPNSGGRFLFTSKGCKRQQLHTDFPGESDPELLRSRNHNPGYFVIATGEHYSPLWVCMNSHREVVEAHAIGRDSLSLLSSTRKAEKVVIPPFSLLVGRGDMFHAGAGDEDSPAENGLMRYHMYFFKPDMFPDDAINLDHAFNPAFGNEEHAEESSYEGGENRGEGRSDVPASSSGSEYE